jgi:hypothetical protein
MRKGSWRSLFSNSFNRTSWISSRLGEGPLRAGSAHGLRPFRSYADTLIIHPDAPNFNPPPKAPTA